MDTNGGKIQRSNKMCQMGITLERFTFWYPFVISKSMKFVWNVYNFEKITVFVQKVNFFLFIGDLKVHELCGMGITFMDISHTIWPVSNFDGHAGFSWEPPPRHLL